MKKIAIATCEKFPNLIESEQGLPELLKSYGIEATPLVWDDPEVDWKAYDRVLIRTVWDYVQKIDNFKGWLARLNEQKIPMSNPYSTLTWNMDKHYLLDLEKKGCTLPPTLFLDAGETVNLPWEKAVLKPTIAAGGHHNRILEKPFHEIVRVPLSGAWMLQEYLKEITTQGEWALIFFGGKFSHAVIKRPAEGEFRVQPRFGGTTTLETPPAEILYQAQKIIDALEFPCVYARVDGVSVHGTLMLMELELIEPDLFLGFDPASPQRFSSAIRQKTFH